MRLRDHLIPFKKAPRRRSDFYWALNKPYKPQIPTYSETRNIQLDNNLGLRSWDPDKGFGEPQKIKPRSSLLSESSTIGIRVKVPWPSPERPRPVIVPAPSDMPYSRLSIAVEDSGNNELEVIIKFDPTKGTRASDTYFNELND